LDALIVGAAFFLPAFFANIAAMVVGRVAKEFGPPFNITVDKIVTLGKRELFGPNKTMLGSFAMVLAALAAGENLTALHENFGIGPKVFDPVWQHAVPVWLLLGTGACLGDLAGSLCKRALRIAAGKDLWVVDQIDWLLGAVVLLWFFDLLPAWNLVAWGSLVLVSARFVLEIPRKIIFPSA